MITLISSLMIPAMILIVVTHGALKKINVYDAFIDGAKESFDMILTMFPSLLAMIFSINIFLKSGIVDSLFGLLRPLFNMIHLPVEVLPMALLRPISGSSTLAILNNIFESFGPDGFIGRLASVIQGSTDTTFYIITLYFGCIGIKKIKYSLWAGLFADLIGLVASIIIVGFFFG